jgi:hypothetical protein
MPFSLRSRFFCHLSDQFIISRVIHNILIVKSIVCFEVRNTYFESGMGLKIALCRNRLSLDQSNPDNLDTHVR